MALITLRQLLDHAAEHGYGVPAFNINNMEQGLAIMEAAKAIDAPVIIQASRGARTYANDIMLAKMIEALAEIYPQSRSACTRTTATTRPPACRAIRHGFTCVMMDGSLMADAKTPACYDYNVDDHRPGRRRWRIGSAPRSRANWACWARWKPAKARPRTATAPKASWTIPAADRPGSGGGFRDAHQGRCAGHRLRHQPRRLQVQPQARRRHPGDERDRGDPQASCRTPTS